MSYIDPPKRKSDSPALLEKYLEEAKLKLGNSPINVRRPLGLLSKTSIGDRMAGRLHDAQKTGLRPDSEGAAQPLKKSGPDPDTQDMTGSSGRTYSRKSIAEGMKRLSKQGGLTPERIEEARGRASGVGVSDELFDKYMGREKLRPSSSPQEAAERVQVARGEGRGLDALEAMQDPNYELGSGSSLSDPARSIGPESGKYRRAARRLERKGYRKAAERMYLDGERVRLGESPITTEEQRNQQLRDRILMAKEAAKQDQIASSSLPSESAKGTGDQPEGNYVDRGIMFRTSGGDFVRNLDGEIKKINGKYYLEGEEIEPMYQSPISEIIVR